ncbi:MAG: hypothetical protein ACOYU0_10020 [Nitrospirota bacterium]
MIPKPKIWERDFSMTSTAPIRRIAVFPLSCTEIEPDLRRCLLTRFPYGIIYGIDSGTVVVIAVAHLHRKPKYWGDRIQTGRWKRIE